MRVTHYRPRRGASGLAGSRPRGFPHLWDHGRAGSPVTVSGRGPGRGKERPVAMGAAAEAHVGSLLPPRSPRERCPRVGRGIRGLSTALTGPSPEEMPEQMAGMNDRQRDPRAGSGYHLTPQAALQPGNFMGPSLQGTAGTLSPPGRECRAPVVQPRGHRGCSLISKVALSRNPRFPFSTRPS